MHIIQTANIVANYFEQNPTIHTVKLSKIQEIKKSIEANFRQQEIFVVVDFTNDSLINMLNISPDLFEREGRHDDSITLKNREKLETEVKWYFNSKVDSKIRENYFEYMKKFKESV